MLLPKQYHQLFQKLQRIVIRPSNWHDANFSVGGQSPHGRIDSTEQEAVEEGKRCDLIQTQVNSWINS